MLLSSDQFDILVNIINSAITDGRSAVALLPVSTIMYRVSRREGGGWGVRERGESEGRVCARKGREGGWDGERVEGGKVGGMGREKPKLNLTSNLGIAEGNPFQKLLQD